MNVEFIDPNRIPGMIEPIERKLLFNLAREISFGHDECAVEFGAFFGKSTSFIALGLAQRPAAARPPSLYVYDSFGCDLRGSFRPVVTGFAKSGGVLHLLREIDNRIDFFPVFNFYLKSQIDSGAVVPNRSELAHSIPPNQVIMLMHIDSPKMYSDFKPILFRFFPKTRVGAVIIFQDFFYHWSATLIAVVGELARQGLIEFRQTAASSLVCVLRERIDEQTAVEIDLALSSDNQILNGIDYAIAECVKIPIDRPEVFLPRLHLAKLQWLIERGNGRLAADVITNFFQYGGTLNQAIVTDFVEMVSQCFSIERLYRIDHDAG